MLIAWLEKIESSKYTRVLVLVAFVLLIVMVLLKGSLGNTLAALVLVVVWFGSACAGIVMGGMLARLLNTQVLKKPAKFAKRLAASFSCFGFLFLPALVGFAANLTLNADIAMYALGTHFLWAIVGGGLFFAIGGSVSTN
ncbi:hypothetical protein [uncultured Tateyamaria sp.]|uniref:hypothetical protein n=1 Tax=uncultured Tateyamaria sp. TaxID=455651 RepID=UPI00261EE747|nr:hypothetical protein [uncultured Tateyamaria sp.]